MNAKEALLALIRSQVPIQARICRVTAVDAAAGLCDLEPQDGSAPLLDVRLTATPGTPGLKLVPKVGSYVIAAHVQNNPSQAWLAQCSELENMELTVGGSNLCTLEIDSSGMLRINGGQLGGLVKVQELATELNKLKAFCETLRTAINAAVPALGDGGTAIKTALVTALASLDTGTFGPNLENPRIKH